MAIFFLNSIESSDFFLKHNLMISATLKGYWMYRNDGPVVFAPKIVFNFGFEKGVFLTKVHFYKKRPMEISG